MLAGQPADYLSMSLPARLGWALGAVVVAYCIAVLTYGSADWLARASNGIWDPGFIGPFRTIIVVLVLAIMIFFAVQCEDRAIRGTWACAAFILLTYSGLKLTGLADPDAPTYWVAHYVLVPLRSMAGLS